MPPHQHTACAALSFCSPPSRERPARAAETPREGGGPWVTCVGATAILSLPPRRAVAQRVMAARWGGGIAAPRTYRLSSSVTSSAGPGTPTCGSAGLRPSPALAPQRQMAVRRSPQHTAGKPKEEKMKTKEKRLLAARRKERGTSVNLGFTFLLRTGLN
ncbi:hypothetical protein Nmel_002060 [Mimus melanotis]